jgi:hypothetical protein
VLYDLHGSFSFGDRSDGKKAEPEPQSGKNFRPLRAIDVLFIA